MKKLIGLFLLGLISYNLNLLFPQAPLLLKYQAVLRDASGQIIASEARSVVIDILQGEPSGTAIFSETHSVTTSDQGIINLNIGSINSSGFAAIDWANGPYYIRINVGGVTMGTSELLSVPYALFAESGNEGPQGIQGPAGSIGPQGPQGIPGTSGTSSWTDGTGKVTTTSKVGIGTTAPGGPLVVKPDVNLSSDSALFEVKDKLGRTVFAVYDNGAVLYVDPAKSKGGRGGFAVGGRSAAKGIIEDIMLVTPDSVRIYLDDNTAIKGGRGGFAVGGRNPAKGVKYDYLYISPDSARIYINDEPLKGGRGGFAVGGRTPTKGSIGNQYLRVTPDSTRIYTSDTIKGFGVGNLSGSKVSSYIKLSPINYFIGHQSGENITPGKPFYWDNGMFNIAYGYQAGKSITSGAYNSLIGYQAGTNITSGMANCYIGKSAGSSTTAAYSNVGIGSDALKSCTTGGFNIAIGVSALITCSTGMYNSGIGYEVLYKNKASSNTAFGYSGLWHNTTGSFNTAEGYAGMYQNTTGSYNTATGSYAMYSNTGGYGNSAFGEWALRSNTTGNFNIAIGDSADVSLGNLSNATAIGYKALVNASNKIVLGNSNVTSIGGYANWTNYSDRRMKENIVYTGRLGLNFIAKLKPVTYNYIQDSNKHRRDGLIAQDVQQVLNDLNIEFSGLVIDDDKDQTMNLSYGEFVIPLINAIQEQQKQIESLKLQNGSLQSQLNDLMEMVEKLAINK